MLSGCSLTPWQRDMLLQGKHRGFFLKRYKLLGQVGSGGMSTVYLGEHEIMQRQVVCVQSHLNLREFADAISPHLHHTNFPVIDDDRRGNPIPLLISLNMLIETPGGFDYCGSDCRRWMSEAGFRETRVEYLVGHDSIVVGIK